MHYFWIVVCVCVCLFKANPKRFKDRPLKNTLHYAVSEWLLFVWMPFSLHKKWPVWPWSILSLLTCGHREKKIESNWRGILLHNLASQIIVYPSCFSTSTFFLSVACWAKRKTNPEEGPCELDHFSLFSSVLPWSEKSRRWWWVQSCTSAKRQYHGRQEDNVMVLLLDSSLGLTTPCLRDMHRAFSLPQKIASSALTRVAYTNKEIHNVSHVA